MCELKSAASGKRWRDERSGSQRHEDVVRLGDVLRPPHAFIAARIPTPGKCKRFSGILMGVSKAVDKVVAQVSQPAVSLGFEPADATNSPTPSDFERAADCKSAIQRSAGEPQ